MGRLFWKFFLCIMLAQVTATIGIGGTFWLKNRAAQQERTLDIDTSPPAQMIIEAASATLEAGGSQALRQFLGKLERMRVFAVDAKGKELMGRTVHPAMLNKAHAMLGQSQHHPVVREVIGSDGVQYLLHLASALRELGKSDPHVFAIEQYLAQLQAPAQDSTAAYPGGISADAGLT